MRGIDLRELVSIEVEVRPAVDLGEGRRYVPFSGGRFWGREGLAGHVLEGGIDWQRARSPEIVEIDAHYALSTDEGESIEVRSTGLRRASSDVAQRILRGEDVDPEAYYFRTHIRLQAYAARLTWLNDLIAVSTGRREKNRVHIHVHEIL